ncbi:MAG: SBBP repeat-containing protein, partial [Raineya sp.]
MKAILLILSYFLVFSVFSQKKPELAVPKEASSSFAFVENKNQWAKEVMYRSDLPSGFLQVSNNALQYTFYDGKAVAYQKHKEFYKNMPEYAHYDKQDGIKAHSFVVEFLGANPVQVQAKKMLPTRYNYYLGEKSTWANNVSAFEEIIYPNIYQGITYHLFPKGNSLKYEISVQAGANPKQIRLQYNYADKVELLPDGTLMITTQVGNIYEKKPVSYQYIKGKKVIIPTEFVLEKNILSFRFPKGYDKRHELIIDPELVFSTYSGGSSDNWGNTATFDDDGNLYSGATLFGLSFPNFTGATTIGTTGSGGTITDVGIFKYNATGTTLLQLTFIGGSASEVPHSLVVDSQNNLFVLGTTSSTNFPVTSGSFQGGTSLTPISGIFYGNGSDIFIVKLNPTGTLNTSILVGGSGNDGLKPSGGTTINNYGDEFR